MACTAQAEGGCWEEGQDGGQVCSRELDLEEDPDVVDGSPGGLKNGPPHANLRVLLSHRPHLSTGKPSKCNTSLNLNLNTAQNKFAVVARVLVCSRARHRKSISTKILWRFTFVPRTPKIITF